MNNSKKYQIVYADPPWNFGNRMYSSNHLDHHRKITRAYPVLKTQEICDGCHKVVHEWKFIKYKGNLCLDCLNGIGLTVGKS
jgi:16S rRNA G966 N2-methylase RsmD